MAISAFPHYATRLGLRISCRCLSLGASIFGLDRRQRIEFNAHRVFGLPHLLEIFKANGLELLNDPESMTRAI